MSLLQKGRFTLNRAGAKLGPKYIVINSKGTFEVVNAIFSIKFLADTL